MNYKLLLINTSQESCVSYQSRMELGRIHPTHVILVCSWVLAMERATVLLQQELRYEEAFL